jgi:hypothetical protein
MEVGAVAHVGEDVLRAAVAGNAEPGRAFAAHVEMVRVLRPIITAIRWQPTPPSAQLPSGTLVDWLCGQPGQNQGVRISVTLGLRQRLALASRKAM